MTVEEYAKEVMDHIRSVADIANMNTMTDNEGHVFIVGWNEDGAGNRCGVWLDESSMADLTPEKFATGFLDTWNERYPIPGWEIGSNSLGNLA